MKAASYLFTSTKADFAESLFDGLGLDKREAKAMVEFFFEEINPSSWPQLP